VLSTTPLLVVSDLRRSLEFFAKLGFARPSVHGEPPCFAMIFRDGFELMLSTGEGRARPRPNGADGLWDVYVRVQDVGAEVRALAAAGVALDRGPCDTFYEMREIEVLDPDGHRICFAQDISGDSGRAAAFAGTLDVGAAKLRLVLHLSSSGGALAGRLDSLDQNAFGMPLDDLERDGAKLRFAMRAIDARFEGEFGPGDRELRGTWTQRGRSWPLVLARE
jgi:catechol 2,3-dioxygenase-like lactoylglutathione lyase family enzyme